MSITTTTTEEDTELRDLVAATLETNGILGKIKAQLRANVYIALEEGDSVKNKSKLVNRKLSDYLSTTNGRLVASLVREFLEFFDLDYTLAVFDPETNTGKDIKFREREKLSEALGLTELTDAQAPLLSEILRLSKVSVLKSESPTPSDVSDDGHTSVQVSLNDDISRKSGLNYSDDFSRSRASDHHSDESPTPEIVLKDSSLDLMRKSSDLGHKKLAPLGDQAKSKDSFLSDLPPLAAAKSSLGDLPPLNPPRNLAPLSKVPTKNNESIKKQTTEAKDQVKLTKKSLDNVPKLGFDQDHVISTSDSVKKDGRDKKHSPESSQEVTENIEEELDSFLNSDISGADITKDETVKEDASLKADYVESL